MRLLLDTHAFLWWLTDDARLSRPAREAIANPDHEVWVSAVTAWEAAVKFRKKRLPEAEPIVAQFHPLLKKVGMKPLSITPRHALRAALYPQAHADPFDRMLAAQAELERLALVTVDRALSDFPVTTVW